MQAGDRQSAAGLDLAGDALVLDRAFGFQRDHRGLWIGLVAILDRGLGGAELGGVHFLLSRILWRVRFNRSRRRCHHHIASPAVDFGSASGTLRWSERHSAVSTRRLKLPTTL